jgi:delta14-sterol reductase
MLTGYPSVSWNWLTRITYSLGAFGIVFGLPILVYSFTFLCNDVSGCPAPSLLHPSSLSINQLKVEVGWPAEGVRAFYDTNVTLCVLGYYLLSLVMYVFLPGQEAEGTELACGGRLQYKFNGTTSVS